MNLRMKLAAMMVMTLAILGVGRRADAAPIQFADNGHYYEFISASLTWDAALAAAATATFDPDGGGPSLPLAGYLVTITSAAEDEFVAGLAALGTGHQPYWLAGSDLGSEGTWTWRAGPETGMVFPYTNWAGGEPNNCCGGEHYLEQFQHHSDGWNDVGTDTMNYVVEFSAVAVPDSPMSAATLLLAFASLMIFYRGGLR